ncbi:MAG: hypothetical protein ABL949_07060 [Fimbriimonadaceae bacterium]
MPIASVLFALALTTQGPIKLSNTFIKDSKTTYSVTLSIDEAEISGDVTFEATDDKGKAVAKSNGIKMKMGGNEMDGSALEQALKFDEKGLANGLEFENDKSAVAVICFAGYCPNAEVKVDSLFEIDEKREGYTIKGTGKLIEVKEVDGKKQATLDYNMTVKPGDGSDGIAKFKSVIDIATGKLISADGTLDIEGRTGTMKIKRK